MPNELDYGIRPLGSYAPAGAPEDYEPPDEFTARVMQMYLENLQKLVVPNAIPQVPAPTRREKFKQAFGGGQLEAEMRQMPQQQAILERQALVQNLNALAPIIQSYMQSTTMTPYQSQQVRLEGEKLEETKRYHTGMLNKPDKPRSRTVYDITSGKAFDYSPDTGVASPIQLPGGGTAGKVIGEQPRTEIADLRTVNSVIDEYSKLGETYGKTNPNEAAAQAQQLAFGTQAGQAFIASHNKDFYLAATARENLLRMVAKMKERNRLSDFDLLQIAPIVPPVASLATKEGRDSFRAQMSKLRYEIKNRVRQRSKEYPSLFSQEELMQLEEDELNLSTLTDEELQEALRDAQQGATD